MSTSAANDAAPARPALTLPAVGLREQALEQLQHHPVREPLLKLRRAGPQNPEPETRRPLTSLLQQSRLPDPGRTLDHKRHPGALPHRPQRSANALDLVLTLEQGVWLSSNGQVHALIDRKRSTSPNAMSGSMSGDLPDVRGADRADHGRHNEPSDQGGHNMPLIQVKALEGVFTQPQKQEIIERLTDTMVEIEGENMRQVTVTIFEEVKSGDWAIGGQTLTTDDAKALARGELATG